MKLLSVTPVPEGNRYMWTPPLLGHWRLTLGKLSAAGERFMQSVLDRYLIAVNGEIYINSIAHRSLKKFNLANVLKKWW